MDSQKAARFWAVIWADILHVGADEGTLAGQLASVERLYKAAARIRGDDDLDRVLAHLDFDAIEMLMSGFLAELRIDTAIRGVDNSNTWRTALHFATTVLRHLSPSAASKAHEIEARLVRMEALYSQTAPRKPKAATPIRALPATVLQDLYELFDPVSPRNPFRTSAQRARNYLLFMLYFHLGLRRGEALLLLLNSFREEIDPATGEQYRWAEITTLEHEDEDHDPRAIRPSLKTPASARRLPITVFIADLITSYTANHRNRAEHRFLLHSQKGGPLAAQTVGDMFATVSVNLSPDALRYLKDRGKKSVTPHDLRHTACVLRLKRYKDSGLSTDDALGKLRSYFGWSHRSTMPTHYARAYWQTDASDVSDARFDAHVEALRHIDHRFHGGDA